MYTSAATQQTQQHDFLVPQYPRHCDEQQSARYTISFSAPGSMPVQQQALPESPFYRLSQQLRCFDEQQQQQGPSSRHSSRSKRTILLLCAVLLLGTVSHRSLSSGDLSSNSSSSGLTAGMRLPRSVRHLDQHSAVDVSSRSSSSATVAAAAACPYGSLPGTWVSTAAAGARWQVLDPDCQLTNWLQIYAAAAAGSSSPTTSSSSGGSSSSDGRTPAAGAAEVAGSSSSTTSSSGGGSIVPDQPPPVRILLLSDSVDRFIVQHVCDYFGGSKQTHSMQPTAAAEAAEAAADQLRQQQQQQGLAPGHHNPPSSLNKTAYAFHTCNSNAPLTLASSYFPGVHPTGPYHRFSAQNYKQRIDSAREMWIQYAGSGNEPDMVAVASLLWDIARIYMHEREKLEGLLFLDRDVLDGWIKNMTQVVEYAQQKFPQTRLWVTHTTMPPHHSIVTGLMTKPYLGRRYFIHQLNAAAATVAQKMGLQLVDYEAVAEPFSEGQKHLVDLIHPNALVGLEVFNLMLNLVIQQQQQQQQQGVVTGKR